MTDEELLQLALKAGFPQWWLNPPEPERQNNEALLLLKRFATLAIAADKGQMPEALLMQRYSELILNGALAQTPEILLIKRFAALALAKAEGLK